ncbi:MAG: NAD(P)H-hydrate dehydratase [Actinomycetota bacterium]
MEPVLTPEEMRAADRRAIASGTPESVLMDRAGRAVAWAARQRLGRTYGARVVVACGPGNNGGDGRVAARVLRGWGARVDVVDVGSGVDAAALVRRVGRADLVVDAMYGTGFRGEMAGDARLVCDVLVAFPGPVVSVDIPSGVDGLTGAVCGVAVRADETVVFAARKPGLLFEPGRSLAGTVRVVDIGIAVTDDGAPPPTFVTTGEDVAEWLPARPADAHKWSAGCLVVGGSGGMTGAPLLASLAALRAGAGMVWCGLPGRDAAVRASGTEVITRSLPDDDGALSAAAAEVVLDDVDRFRSVAIGPGLGRADGTAVAVRRLVSEVAVPLVVDADALHALAGHLDALQHRRVPAVLTPHAGEYAALSGSPLSTDRVEAARVLAAATGAVVLVKGPGTVVADPAGRAAICPLGGSGLATAGTGDVLTGIVAAFLARGVPPFEAAAAAAFVHAGAADRAGHTGLVAGDLVAALPATLAACAPGAPGR